MQKTGVLLNSYAQYQRFGSLCHPFWTILDISLNWSICYGVFFLLGGHALATALFAWAAVWHIGIRTFNYDGHGRGTNQQREGIDFSQNDFSLNQNFYGFVAGEWHNNHHLYPKSARAGFLNYQIDLPWLFIRILYRLGAIKSYRDSYRNFFCDYYNPWKKQKFPQK